VTVNSFLAEGGDGFDVLTEGTDRKGGGQDVDALIAYLAASERAPIAEARIARLP
jgi:5'-nucleotidase